MVLIYFILKSFVNFYGLEMIHYFLYEMLVHDREGIRSTVTFKGDDDRRKSRPLVKISILLLHSNGSVLWKDQFERCCNLLKKGGLRKCEEEVIPKGTDELFPFFNRDVGALIHIEMRGLTMGLGMQNVNLKCGPHGCLKNKHNSFSIFLSLYLQFGYAMWCNGAFFAEMIGENDSLPFLDGMPCAFDHIEHNIIRDMQDTVDLDANADIFIGIICILTLSPPGFGKIGGAKGMRKKTDISFMKGKGLYRTGNKGRNWLQGMMHTGPFIKWIDESIIR